VDSLNNRWSQEIEPLTGYGVYRAQKEFDKGRQGLGFISTVAMRSFADGGLRDVRNSSSLLVGADGGHSSIRARPGSPPAWISASRTPGFAGPDDKRCNRTRRNYFQQPDGEESWTARRHRWNGASGRITLN